MKEIKRTETVEKITGYEAFDGKLFNDKDECQKYEETAYGVIGKEFRTIMVNGDEFAECSIWESYGYGSDEYCLAVLDIKTEKELEIANRYYEIVGRNSKDLAIDSKYIGKRVLVNTGCVYDRNINPCPRTEEELIEQFAKNLKNYFMSTAEIAEAKTKENV